MLIGRLKRFEPRSKRPARTTTAAARGRCPQRCCGERRSSPSELLEPDAAHHLPQPRRPGRVRGRHPLPLPVARRADRRPHPEPAGAGRDHRRRDRRLGRSIPTAPPSIPTGCSKCRSASYAAPRREPARFPDQPRAGGAAPARLVTPTKTRARIYERDGTLILDSLALYDVLRFDLPAPESTTELRRRRSMSLPLGAARRPAALSRARADEGSALRGGRAALTGSSRRMVRINDRTR